MRIYLKIFWSIALFSILWTQPNQAQEKELIQRLHLYSDAFTYISGSLEMNQYNSPHDIVNVYQVENLWSELAMDDQSFQTPKQITWSLLENLSEEQLNWLASQIRLQNINTNEYQIRYDILCKELHKPLENLTIDSISLEELAYNTNLLKGIIAVTNREIIDTLETKLSADQKAHLDSLVMGLIGITTKPDQKAVEWIENLNAAEWQTALGTLNNLVAIRHLNLVSMPDEFYPVFHAPYFGSYYLRDQDTLIFTDLGQQFFAILDSSQQQDFQEYYESIKNSQSEVDSLLGLNYQQLAGAELDLNSIYTAITENGVLEGQLAAHKAKFFAQVLCSLRDDQILQIQALRDTSIIELNQQICPSSGTEISNYNGLEFKFFPNPAHDKITILLHDEIRSAQISLFQFNGLHIYEEAIKYNSGEHTLDISSLPTGLYVLGVKSKLGIISLPFVKQ